MRLSCTMTHDVEGLMMPNRDAMQVIADTLGSIREFLTHDSSRRVLFGTGGIYFQIPRLRLTLFAGVLDGTMSQDLSIRDAMAIFESIRLAYDGRDLQMLKAGAITCTTDCRVQPKYPEHVEIKFEGRFGLARMSLRRADIAAALNDFEKKVLQAL